MTVRHFTYTCPRCSYTIPASSKAKERFDSFCPRCNRRITIYWPQRQRSIWDDRRGRKRVVSYRAYHSRADAVEAAEEANFAMIQHRHRSSIFGQERIDAGFVPASRLTQDEIQRKRDEKR